jgi:dTDP-glucose 4,6-dehydratase
VRFAEGIAQTIDWYKNNRSWWEPLKAKAALENASGAAGGPGANGEPAAAGGSASTAK